MNLKEIFDKKTIIVVIVTSVIMIAMYIVAKKLRKTKDNQKKKEFLKEVMQQSVDSNGESYAKKAQELEALIFARHTVLYGWESDIDGILKLFANYSKKDVDNVLKAYSILYPPGNSGGSWVGDIVNIQVPGMPEKTYKGNAFLDLQNIEDKKDYERVLIAYENIK